MEIQSIHSRESRLVSIYGFGSLFRGEVFNDCDLLLVVRNDCEDLGSLHKNLNEIFFDLGLALSIIFDITILTEREHDGKPLREHDSLVPISLIGNFVNNN